MQDLGKDFGAEVSDPEACAAEFNGSQYHRTVGRCEPCEGSFAQTAAAPKCSAGQTGIGHSTIGRARKA